MNSIPDREKRRQSLQCRLYGLPRAYPRMQGEGMLERTTFSAAALQVVNFAFSRVQPSSVEYE